MHLRWSPAAVEDLFRIIEYIQQENPAAAQRIAKTIYESAGSLKSFPNKGRAGRVGGTRELPLPPLPFVVVYRILTDTVEIANVIHGHRNGRKKIEVGRPDTRLLSASQ